MTNTQKMVRLNLDLSPELNQILDELAKKIGTSKSDVLHQAITLMQIMVIAKEETKKLGVPEANQLIVNEIILSSEQQPKAHPLDTFMERVGPALLEVAVDAKQKGKHIWITDDNQNLETEIVGI